MTAKTVLNIHPKLATAAATGLGIAVVTAVSTKIDPSLFVALGPWATAATVVATTALSVFAGWLKSVRASEDAEDQSTTDAVEAAAEPVAESAFDKLIQSKEAPAPAETQSEVVSPAPAVQSTVVA